MPEQSELPQQKGKRGKIIINSRKEPMDMICKRLTEKERPTFPKRAVITAGMPYGNKNLHFGHVGGMLIHADIFARFLRDRIGKNNVIFLSGTEFSQYMGIPLRTLEEWEAGRRMMPEYVLRLIAYFTRMERFLHENEIAIEEETDA